MIDHVLDVIAAEQRARGLGRGRPDPLGDVFRRILVIPDAADNPDGLHLFEQAVHTGILFGTTRGLQHHVQGFDGIFHPVDVMLDLRGADEYRCIRIRHSIVHFDRARWKAGLAIRLSR